jgi:ACT domain-containing protein
MKAVITVVGKDMVGILAKVSNTCAKANVNIADVNQTILDDYFTMVMLVEIDKMNMSFDEFRSELEKNVPTMKIHVMHEDIFNAMHRI